MGLFKWFASIGAVGGTTRWVIKTYKELRKQYPDRTSLSEMDLFRMIVELRYSVIPDREAKDFLVGYLSRTPIGLRTFIDGIQLAESRLSPFEYPSAFREIVSDELAKSGLPKSIIDDP